MSNGKVLPFNGEAQKQQETHQQWDWRKKLAMQIAVQLPENHADALIILALARDLLA